MLTDSQSVLPRAMNWFCQILSVRGVSGIRQVEIHTTVPLVLESSSFEVELAVEMLKIYNSRDNDEIPAKLVIRSGITNTSVLFGVMELPEQLKACFVCL